ncbi:hypothetical protein [Thermoflavimicrobium daqui]|uniref:Uncharacterized protein n=1 Tax=Thermoflavimicrobium daqui TaxID=2137476 RepID=A0A364K7X0_9BACL|nr:hypothetical protein [Thermoflavimicrobium daqui]RAL26300.1 hypothetical protein DL897_04710 [Thermoflavimicrobium daqui]
MKRYPSRYRTMRYKKTRKKLKGLRYRLHSKRQHRRRLLSRRRETNATIQNIASINGPISGYINIIIQIPTNFGNATVINDCHDASVNNKSG